jgi:hypothetical protein
MGNIKLMRVQLTSYNYKLISNKIFSSYIIAKHDRPVVQAYACTKIAKFQHFLFEISDQVKFTSIFVEQFSAVMNRLKMKFDFRLPHTTQHNPKNVEENGAKC